MRRGGPVRARTVPYWVAVPRRVVPRWKAENVYFAAQSIAKLYCAYAMNPGGLKFFTRFCVYLKNYYSYSAQTDSTGKT